MSLTLAPLIKIRPQAKTHPPTTDDVAVTCQQIDFIMHVNLTYVYDLFLLSGKKAC